MLFRRERGRSEAVDVMTRFTGTFVRSIRSWPACASAWQSLQREKSRIFNVLPVAPFAPWHC